MPACARQLLDGEELRALAGKWDRYPHGVAIAPACPVCGAEARPLGTYCGRECFIVAQKRLGYALAMGKGGKA